MLRQLSSAIMVCGVPGPPLRGWLHYAKEAATPENRHTRQDHSSGTGQPAHNFAEIKEAGRRKKQTHAGHGTKAGSVGCACRVRGAREAGDKDGCNEACSPPSYPNGWPPETRCR